MIPRVSSPLTNYSKFIYAFFILKIVLTKELSVSAISKSLISFPSSFINGIYCHSSIFFFNLDIFAEDLLVPLTPLSTISSLHCLSALAFPLETASDSAYSCSVAAAESLSSSCTSLRNSFRSLTFSMAVLFPVSELSFFNILEHYSCKIHITSIYPYIYLFISVCLPKCSIPTKKHPSPCYYFQTHISLVYSCVTLLYRAQISIQFSSLSFSLVIESALLKAHWIA